MDMYNHLPNFKERGTSPVIGVILVVLITVGLATLIGVSVFDLGQSTSGSPTDQSTGVRTTYVNGEVVVQVISSESDELQVHVNGSHVDSIDSPTAGDELPVTADENAEISVVSVTNGNPSVVLNTKASSDSNSASTPPPNTPPTASMSSDTTLANRDASIEFSGSSSTDSNGDELSYSWEFGDGSSATGENVSHSYTDPGDYTVTLTVDDGNGGTDTNTQSITVEAVFYDKGAELVEWSPSAAGNEGNGTTEKRINELYMYADAQTDPSAGRGFETGEVDLSNVDTVYVEYKIDSRRSTMEGNNQTGALRAGIVEDNARSSYSQEDVESYTHEGIIEVDASNNSSGTIRLRTWAHSSNGGETEAWISRVWGE